MVEFTLPEVFQKHEADQTIDEIPNLEELARIQQAIEHRMNRWDAMKAYKNIVFIIGVNIWTMVLWGYESQAGGMVISIPEFRQDFGEAYDGSYVLPAKWQSAISGGPTGAIGVGAVLGSFLADKIGKRRTMMLASLISIPFITAEYVATKIEIFFIGKFFNAFCLGIIAACCSSYTSEVAPLALRGLASGAIALALSVGPFICVLINNTTSTYTTRMAYRGIFIPQWIFAITSIIGQSFIPESPYWLLSKSRDKDAMRSLKNMYGDNVESQYALMKVTVDEATLISSKQGSYLDLFRKADIRRTLLVVFAYSMQAFCGVSYVTNYATYYYQLSGYDTQKSFQISVGGQALSIFGVVTTFFIVDRFGRRPLVLGATTMMTIANLFIACTGLNLENHSAVRTSAAFMCMYNFVYNVGMGPLPYILGNEILSVFLRIKTFAVASFCNHAFQCMWTAVLPYMFNPDKADMGSSINFIFTGFSFAAIFVFYFFMPETAHRSFEEIDEMFGLNIPARKWKNHRTEKQDKTDEVLKKEVDHLERVKKV